MAVSVPQWHFSCHLVPSLSVRFHESCRHVAFRGLVCPPLQPVPHITLLCNAIRQAHDPPPRDSSGRQVPCSSNIQRIKPQLLYNCLQPYECSQVASGKIIAIATVYTCFLGRYNEARDGILFSCDDCRPLLLAPLQRSVMIWCVVFGRPLLPAFICAGKS